jgi:hypothetical protein
MGLDRFSWLVVLQMVMLLTERLGVHVARALADRIVLSDTHNGSFPLNAQFFREDSWV